MIDLGAEVKLVTGEGTAAVLSRDESMMVFVGESGHDGRSQLYLRRLDEFEATPLVGTEDATQPTFSPDSQWIVYRSGKDLKKIAVTGGPAVRLCETGASRGLDSTRNGSIVFSSNK